MRTFAFSGGSFTLGKKTYLMGILNVTPDSFFDGGRFFSPEAAVARAKEMQNEGADLIDLGVCSTRPGGEVISQEEELKRLSAVFDCVRAVVSVPLSVDTFRPAAAKYVLERGADIINDVSGVVSRDMAALIKAYDAGWVLMHSGPENAETADETDYPGGVSAHVQAFFDLAKRETEKLGITPEHICLDPGFGFAKNTAQNTALLKDLNKLQTGGCALLAAFSRKRFIGEISGEKDVGNRLLGTLAANISAVEKGADILRVHDVKEHLPAITAADRIYR